MASWYSNLVTKTSSQISSLRSTLLSGEADGDTEDDTHVCRVLRNYYTDKGRPLPSWLPPDPKAPQQAPVQPLYSQPQVGSRYGGLGGQNAGQGGGGGLSSLWDSNPNQNQAPPPQSLRAGRGAGSAPPAMAQIGSRPADAPPTRQLPSQQRPSAQQSAGGSGGGSSAQDRLRQRLWGGARTTSPQQGGQSQGPFQPPSSGGGGGGGGGGGNYEDRFAPGGSYDSGRSRGGNDQPYMSANSPWSGGGDDFMGGGGYGGGGGSDSRPAPSSGPGRRMGLPSGPRGYK